MNGHTIRTFSKLWQNVIDKTSTPSVIPRPRIPVSNESIYELTYVPSSRSGLSLTSTPSGKGQTKVEML